MRSICNRGLKFRSLFASLLIVTSTAIPNLRAATNAIASGAAIDPDFVAGLARVKQATGIIENSAGHADTLWAPDLQLLIGMCAAERSNRLIRFVELTTLHPPSTNASGQPWSPALRTNRFGWSGTNASSHRTLEYVSALYPVRIRVFDATGLMIKESTTKLPWELLTNSLAETCRVSLSDRSGVRPSPSTDSDEFARPFIGGMLSLFTVFGEIQSNPALDDVCEKARCAVRMPTLWSLLKAAIGRPLVVNFEPRFKEISVQPIANEGAIHYRLPMDMKSNKEALTTIEIIAGPAAGPNVLLAGIRSIRAVHPAKKDHVFMAQVLAAGTSQDP